MQPSIKFYKKEWHIRKQRRGKKKKDIALPEELLSVCG